MVGAAFVVKVSARRGTFLLVPHGPVASSGALRKEMLTIFSERLRKLAKEEGASFVRLNPVWKRGEGIEETLSQLAWRRAPIQMHPEASWKLDISKPEEELFSAMRKTTRYLIRKAQENPDITVEVSCSAEDVALFSEMHNLVSRRQHFVPFSLEYLQREFEAFSKDKEIALFIGRYKGEVVAMSFVVFWSGIAFYHHASSLPQFARFSIPYLLSWKAICEAKKRGCTLYDFWGYVDPKSSHPWAGPTLFKMGFGGEAHEYVLTHDLPLTFRYWITWVLEKIRKMRRGL